MITVIHQDDDLDDLRISLCRRPRIWHEVDIGRVPLVVAANEIIIGGLSHSSSTAAWQSGWLCGAVAAER